MSTDLPTTVPQVFTSPVTVPSDGDPLVVATIIDPLQALKDRTEFLQGAIVEPPGLYGYGLDGDITMSDADIQLNKDTEFNEVSWAVAATGQIRTNGWRLLAQLLDLTNAPVGGINADVNLSSTGEAFTIPGSVNFDVPAGTTSIDIVCVGAGGGGGEGARGYGGSSTGTLVGDFDKACAGGLGGAGGFMTASIPVTPGETLTILVGDGGLGGTGSSYFSGQDSQGGRNGGLGGGVSAVLRGGTILAIAGAGGGGSGGGSNGVVNSVQWESCTISLPQPGVGGAGGGTTGAAGTTGSGTPEDTNGVGGGGAGGTPSVGGAGGTTGVITYIPGSLSTTWDDVAGVDGSIGSAHPTQPGSNQGVINTGNVQGAGGGGGGQGFFSGGSGASGFTHRSTPNPAGHESYPGGGGGGGSSYVDPSATASSFSQGGGAAGGAGGSALQSRISPSHPDGVMDAGIQGVAGYVTISGLPAPAVENPGTITAPTAGLVPDTLGQSRELNTGGDGGNGGTAGSASGSTSSRTGDTAERQYQGWTEAAVFSGLPGGGGESGTESGGASGGGAGAVYVRARSIIRSSGTTATGAISATGADGANGLPSGDLGGGAGGGGGGGAVNIEYSTLTGTVKNSLVVANGGDGGNGGASTGAGKEGGAGGGGGNAGRIYTQDQLTGLRTSAVSTDGTAGADVPDGGGTGGGLGGTGGTCTQNL